ncbi:MAG TPA: hypothetical protein VLL27_14120 [Solirubrobacterales bacterium]|nr:hypothetical protein [Solirubrobacterales bacterium]
MIVIGAQTGFYEAAVQVIPVLLLVLVVGDGRIIKTDREKIGEWRSATLAALFATGVLLLGELAALRVLERGHDTFLLRGLTVMGLIYGFLGVFAQATMLMLLGRKRELSPVREEALGRFWVLIIVVALVVSVGVLMPELPLFQLSS